MTSLEKRRERGDAIAVFKILKNFDDTGSHQYFNLVENDPEKPQTRTNSDKLNLKTRKFNTEIGRHRFSTRVIHLWNSIPGYIKDSSDVNQFKHRFDEYVKEQDDIRRAGEQGIDFSLRTQRNHWAKVSHH